MGMPKLVVADNDGTITNLEIVRKSFETPFYRGLAALLERKPSDVMRLVRALEPKIDPAVDVWVYDGFVAAPAVDPLMRATCIAKAVAGAMRKDLSTEVVQKELGRIYFESYPKMKTHFKPGAKELVGWLVERDSVVVTNSDTKQVCDKLSTLERGSELAHRVFGGAKKYVITPDELDWVAWSLPLPGLKYRDVLLRRNHYYQVIRTEMEKRDISDWEHVLVFGDIFELDLALPLQLGAHVILVHNEHTPAYELDYLRGHPRARTAGSLEELLGHLEAME